MNDDTLWIHPNNNLTVGQFGFLIEYWYHVKKWKRYDLLDKPIYRSEGSRPIMYGRCGGDSEVSNRCYGIWRVERISSSGRVLVVKLEDDELADALDELGYLELLL